MTRDVLDAGGVGATYGRFIFQYRNPVALIRAVDAVIHGDASVREAVGLLEELEHKVG